MKNLFCAFIAMFVILTTANAQLVGDRLEIGQTYTFESESGPGLFISYGDTEGRAGLSAANRQFKVVAALNGKAGYVSFQAVQLSSQAYLVMGDPCPRPYTGGNFYKVANKPANDATFNANASYRVGAANSNRADRGLVSILTEKGYYFKREQGVLMDATGAGVAPRYQNHFAFKIKASAPATKSGLGTGETLKTGEKLVSANGQYMLIMQTDGNLCIYRYANGKQGAFVWCSMKHGFSNAKLVMQTDGNLCVYDGNNRFRWGSYQVKRYALGQNYKFVLTDAGKLNVVNASGQVVWTN